LSVGQAGQALIGVAAAPVAHGVDVHPLPGGDLGVGVTVGGVAHDPGADDLLVAGGMGVGQGFELSPVGGGQRDLACAGHGHGRAFTR
jgi:hypothetical protein